MGFSPSFRASSFRAGYCFLHGDQHIWYAPDATPQKATKHKDAGVSDYTPHEGGHVKSLHPSDKERLACTRCTSLFDLMGLATDKYHSSIHGVQTLSVPFIHNCGYQSFLNTMSPEDVLLCFSEIQQIHKKVVQSWHNMRNQTSGPSIKRILDHGIKVFLKLHTLDIHDAVKFYDKFQELSTVYLIPLMFFDAVCLDFNFEGLFIPGLSTKCYAECATAMMEILP
jgi:hypothetical protein